VALPDGGMSPPLPDAAPVTPDVAVPVDVAMVIPDAALPPPDLTAPAPDAAVSYPDSPPPPPDAAAPPPDMEIVSLDAMVIEEDAAPPPPDMASSPDTSAAKLILSPTGTDFGDVEVNTSSAGVDFIVTNVGDLPSGVPTAQVPSDYAVESSTCTAPVAPQGNCVVRVHMTPTQTGPRGGSLIVSAAPGGTTTAALMGNGAFAAKLDLQPQLQPFGNVAPGQTSLPYTLILHNAGGLKSGTPSLVVQPTNSPFTITNNLCAAPLDPGGSCQVTMTFTAPTTVGPSSAQLQAFASPGGNASAMLVANSTFVEVTPRNFDFGDVSTVSAMKGQDFTVWHLGPAGSPMLSVMSMINGTNPTDFTITSTTCANGLSPGNTCTISITFQPRTIGPKSVILDLAAHDLAAGTAEGTDKAPLNGNGI
jgi:hypothetical protein